MDNTNIKVIGKVGLLSRPEREQNNITSIGQNRAVFGHGIYTSNNPMSFKRYVDRGILVARLQG
jgi:hypothetical protein